MTPFCTDIDLLHWEPNILQSAAFASQTLLSGTADISGTTMTISAGSLTDSQIEPNQIVVLSGSINGNFPIVSITSATTLTISVLCDSLFPDTGSPVAAPIGSASGQSFVIRTFWPQRRIVSEILQQAAGIIPGDVKSANWAILNLQSLCHACSLGTLQLIYSALSAVSGAPADYKVRADLYQTMYQQAMRSTRVEIDTNGDGKADCYRKLNIADLIRV